MQIITIARQLGAGGGAIASQLAERLGWRLFDRELVERIAAELDVPPDALASCDERTGSFLERLGSYLAEGMPEMLPPPHDPPLSPDLAAETARRIVASVAESEPAVIVGHGAQCILGRRRSSLHVLVHAPVEVRVARAAERLGLGSAEARARVRRSDGDRAGYIRAQFDREWLDPTLYHLCVDSSLLGVEGTAEMIARVARDPGLEPRSG